MSLPPTLARSWRRSAGVAGLLTGAAQAHPDTPFLSDRFGSAWSYAETEVRARAFAAWLRHQGIGRGDRVAVVAQNRAEIVVAVFGCALVGAVFVVLNPKLRPKGLAAILAQAEPSAIVFDSSTAELVAEGGAEMARLLEIGGPAWEEALSAEPPESEWEGCDLDPASLVFTSGSTGTPRGVVLSQDNITFVVGAIQARLGYRPGDMVGVFLPLAFDYGLYQIFLAAQAGARLHLGDPSEVGPRLPRTLREAGVTVLPGVPSVCAALIALGRRGPLGLPALHAVTNTGERLPPSYIEELRRLLPGVEIFVMYGLTECKRVSILLPRESADHADSVGRALDGTEVYAVDAGGNRLPPGETGELVVKGRHVALGYWRAPEETARRFRKRAPESAVELFTGDAGSVDAGGFLRFSARSDDWIKHRGYRISPLEIENEACEIAGIVEAALLQRESDETLHLFVTVSGGGADPAALQAELAEVLEAAKVPDHIRVLDEMPKSINGKIDRKALVERLAD